MDIPTARQIASDMASRARQRRIKQGLTQEALAEKADVALSTYKRFEQQGLIALESLLKVAIVLNQESAFEDLFASRPSETEYASLDEVEESFTSAPPRQSRVREVVSQWTKYATDSGVSAPLIREVDQNLSLTLKGF